MVRGMASNHPTGHTILLVIGDQFHINFPPPLQIERSGNDAFYSCSEIRRGGVQGSASDQRHHHRRWHRHQSTADGGQCLPETRIRVAVDTQRPSGRRICPTLIVHFQHR